MRALDAEVGHVGGELRADDADGALAIQTPSAMPRSEGSGESVRASPLEPQIVRATRAETGVLVPLIFSYCPVSGS